jgi:2-polyprenyl-3-methyl-5-hydroxy-6-metoxy-1,4-benzoquinol methylase
MENNANHEQFAQESKGISDNSIYQHILSKINFSSHNKVLDIGCGAGHLLKIIKEKAPLANFYGVDLIQYPEATHFELIKQNLNDHFSFLANDFDLIISTEVIEHLENPRLFLRELIKKTKPHGKIILTTPNPYSLLSLLSFCLKGYHSSFGPKDYPAHITPITPFQMKNMISEIEGIRLLEISYIPNGRIPGSGIRYSKYLPFLKGKRFSDNYCTVIQKV